MQQSDRRDFLKLAGMAGVTFTAGLFPAEQAVRAGRSDFHFVQFSDTHGATAALPIPTPSTRWKRPWRP